MEVRKKILGIFNDCSCTNIPLENFIKLNTESFSLYLISFYQTKNEAQKEIKNLYPDVEINVYGLGIKIIFNPKLLRFYKLLKKINPDVIHVHHNFSGLLASFFGRYFTKAKLIATVHNDFLSFNKRQQLLFLLTYMFSNILVCNSYNTKKSIEKLRKIFFQKKQVKVIYNGVDTKAIEKKLSIKYEKIIPKNNDIFCVGTVGRLVKKKDHETLIKAYAHFCKNYRNTILVIAGDGPLKENLLNLVKKLEINKNVLFLGHILRNKVYSLLNEIDIFVISSRYEGFCNAMVEAMVARKTIIASNIEPLPEVLGKDCGLFFEYGDISGLCANMKRLFKIPALRKELGSKARKKAVSKYSLEICARNYEKTYKQLIKYKNND